MNIMHKRWISTLVCIVLLATLILPSLSGLEITASAAPVATEFYEDYTTVSLVKNLGDCPST